jgi:hypothetical protein
MAKRQGVSKSTINNIWQASLLSRIDPVALG